MIKFIIPNSDIAVQQVENLKHCDHLNSFSSMKNTILNIELSSRHSQYCPKCKGKIEGLIIVETLNNRTNGNVAYSYLLHAVEGEISFLQRVFSSSEKITIKIAKHEREVSTLPDFKFRMGRIYKLVTAIMFCRILRDKQKEEEELLNYVTRVWEKVIKQDADNLGHSDMCNLAVMALLNNNRIAGIQEAAEDCAARFEKVMEEYNRQYGKTGGQYVTQDGTSITLKKATNPEEYRYYRRDRGLLTCLEYALQGQKSEKEFNKHLEYFILDHIWSMEEVNRIDGLEQIIRADVRIPGAGAIA